MIARRIQPQIFRTGAAARALALVVCLLSGSVRGNLAAAQQNPYNHRQQAGQGRPNQPQQQPQQRREPDAQQFQSGGNGFGRQNSQHLGQWMDSHRNLPPEQQQRALAAEPGFRQLQPQVQQRMYQRLNQLNSMSPDQRARVLSRNEQMERLPPEQRQQIRGAMQQLGSLPDDRRHAVARAYHQLNSLPQQQRDAYMNSPQYRGQFNDQERDTMNHLLAVSPYLPQTPPQGPQAPR